MPVRAFLPGTQITVKPRKDKYFLGENILLDYQISYDGDGMIEVENGSGYGSFATATDAAGNPVPESTLPFGSGGSGGGPVWRDRMATITMPLMRYCRFEKPGEYRVRVIYDLGWSKRDDSEKVLRAAPKDDPRWAETTVVLAMPDADQARQVVDHMHRLRTDADYYQHNGYFFHLSDFADFTCLQYPVYLPILEELAAAKDGDAKALMGIAHIPTTDATEALIRLLKHPEPGIRPQGRRRCTTGFPSRRAPRRASGGIRSRPWMPIRNS